MVYLATSLRCANHARTSLIHPPTHILTNMGKESSEWTLYVLVILTVCGNVTSAPNNTASNENTFAELLLESNPREFPCPSNLLLVCLVCDVDGGTLDCNTEGVFRACPTDRLYTCFSTTTKIASRATHTTQHCIAHSNCNDLQWSIGRSCVTSADGVTLCQSCRYGTRSVDFNCLPSEDVVRSVNENTDYTGGMSPNIPIIDVGDGDVYDYDAFIADLDPNDNSGKQGYVPETNANNPWGLLTLPAEEQTTPDADSTTTEEALKPRKDGLVASGATASTFQTSTTVLAVVSCMLGRLYVYFM